MEPTLGLPYQTPSLCHDPNAGRDLTPKVQLFNTLKKIRQPAKQEGQTQKSSFNSFLTFLATSWTDETFIELQATREVSP